MELSCADVASQLLQQTHSGTKMKGDNGAAQSSSAKHQYLAAFIGTMSKLCQK